MPVHHTLHKTLRMLKRALVLLLIIAISLASASLALIAWSEFNRSRHLDRLFRETSVPAELINPGNRPLASLFASSEERICVLHPYTGNRGIPEMSSREKYAVRRLDLPSEDLTWYVVAFQGNAITRVLLLNEMTTSKLASDSMCFGRGDVGLIRVQEHPSTSPPSREVHFIKREQ